MKKKYPGFTLIELMIVVVIIGIIFSIALPLVLKTKDKIKSNESFEQNPKIVNQIRTRGKSEIPKEEINYVAPQTLTTDIKVDLSTTNYIKGFDVYTLFTADFKGEFTFMNKDKTNDNVKLLFLFPKNTTQVNEVMLKIKDPAGNFFEPDDVIYSPDNITRYIKLGYHETATVLINYKAEGNEKYIYETPENISAKTFKMSIKIDNAFPDYIPKYSLQPTKISENMYIWDLKNIVTNGKIIVELPGTTSPIGKIILFFKLAGLAVLLFGLGLLYISGLDQPGRLDSFRLGHFLLLAVTYSLFFVNYVVLSLGRDIDVTTSLTLAAVFSLPLLILHVSKAWGVNFGIGRVLPLAVFTLGIVVNGVYGGEYKRYIFLGFVFITISFLIMSYGTWTNQRKLFLEKKEKERKHKEEELKKLEEKNIQDIAEKKKEELETDNSSFCVSCGVKSSPSKYCPGCGILKPVELICVVCGIKYKVPIHLIDEKNQEKYLHCTNCGSGYNLPLSTYKNRLD